MYNRAQMKQSVKRTIAATRPRPIWIALLFMVVTSVVASIINSIVTALSGVSALSNQLAELLYAYDFTDIADIEAAISEIVLLYGEQLLSLIGVMASASMIGSILVALWQSLMTVGYQGYCLSMVRGENPGPGKIFCGFPLVGKVVVTAILRWVFTFLWTLLYVVIFAVVLGVGALLMETVSEIFVILPILGYIALLVMIIRLALRYAMADYFLLDTGIWGLDAIAASKQMMKGKKGKLFVLELSFIGWFLLEYVIILVGCVIIGVLAGIGAAGAAASGSLVGLAGLIVGALAVLIVMLVAIWLISAWLNPYVNGSVAKFYLTFKPQQEGVPTALPVEDVEKPLIIEVEETKVTEIIEPEVTEIKEYEVTEIKEEPETPEE